MENEEYQQLKKNMDKEIQESPTYSFGNRKWSVKVPPPMNEHTLSKRNFIFI